MEENTIDSCKVLLIGGSAGSLEVLIRVLPGLHKFTFSVVIVLHRKSTDDNLLEELLSLKTSLPVKEIEDKTPLEKGSIYIAPADYHLLLEKDGLFGLDVSDKVNYSRPSIDVVFQSAADAYGKGVVAILLSGANADGTEGLKAIMAAGGRVVVQDPATAEMPYMPQYAISQLIPDLVFGPEEITDFINKLN
ncbi:chemotaxis protein CheB [Flavobacterium sp. RHBU_24]|uniref:chemotaxis protein CheB n=1 Tax=Flavobacterium sp. RHBU_24 TaxID=3391185 RepID=UPI003984A4F1